jgi:transcriptional regulator with XRE-family HTH domain
MFPNMSIIMDDLDSRLGARIRTEREGRGWSLTDLAQRSGVSRAMINKVERGDASPTASLLGRLSGAFGLTLSTLLAGTEAGRPGRLVRAEDQLQWTDPATGYVRRQVAPGPGSDLPLDVVQVELPAGASVSFPATAYVFIRQLVWVLDGCLTFIEGEVVHALRAGDCLELGSAADCTYRNDHSGPCVYVVTVLRTSP